MSRRGFLKLSAGVVGGFVTNRLAADGSLRFGLTPVFLDDRAGLLQEWRGYLARRLDRPVHFVQRGSYREVIELLRDGQLDLAWLCGYPYVRESAILRLVVAPIYRGEPLYRSYLIVPNDDFETSHIDDLRGKLFAYSDPDSLSGYVLPRVRIRRHGGDPERYFARGIFTWTHRNSIRAVADRLVDGAAVDGYVWDMLEEAEPLTAGLTRVVCRSAPYGFPPIVSRRALGREEALRLGSVFREMAADPTGQRILAGLGLDRFEPVSDALYDDVRTLLNEQEGRVPHA